MQKRPLISCIAPARDHRGVPTERIKGSKEDEMAQTLDLVLRRHAQDEPWGFRLQGGVDFKTPLSVQMVSFRSSPNSSQLFLSLFRGP